MLVASKHRRNKAICSKFALCSVTDMVIWALFDSGHGCYRQAVEKYFPNITIYSIGLDIENKNNHFISLDLSDYSEIFTGVNRIFEALEALPSPDAILASPPCESWSMATAMRHGTNYWQQIQEIDTLFGSYEVPTNFTLQKKANVEMALEKRNGHFKPFWHKLVYNQVNGILCAFNTLRIIERYAAKVWVIENPQTSKIWDYYEQIHGFVGVRNVAHYNYYDVAFSKKPTTFFSNIYLDLKTTPEAAAFTMGKSKNRPKINGYNNRSAIPLELIRQMLKEIQIKINEVDKIGFFCETESE